MCPRRKVVKKWVRKEGPRVNAEAVKTSEANKDTTPAAQAAAALQMPSVEKTTPLPFPAPHNSGATSARPVTNSW